MNWKRVLTFGALAGGVTLSTVAIARGPHGGPFGHLQRVLAELDLTPEQQEMFQEMRDEFRAERDAVRAEREADFEVILEELSKAKPDRKKLDALVDARFEAAQQRFEERLDGFLDVHATFTPEQRATLVAELEEGKARMEERREQLQDGAPGPRERRGGERVRGE